MSPSEAARIRDAAIKRGRQERREQGIPEQIKSDDLGALLLEILRGGGGTR